MANVGNVTNALMNYTTGAVMTAPVGTALPTSASSAMPAAFKDWGFVGEDGITETIERETENILDANGSTVLVITKSHSVKFKFKPLELTAEGLRTILGDASVTEDASGSVASYAVNDGALTPRAYVFNLMMADGRLMRVCCPKGQVASIGEDVMKSSDVMAKEIEVEMLADAAGNKAYVYYANPTATGRSILSYSIRALGMDFPGDIDEAAGTIGVTVPNGTSLTALVATFSASSGASVKIGGVSQVSGTTSNSFATPKTYDVTNAAGASKQYVVTVTAASA